MDRYREIASMSRRPAITQEDRLPLERLDPPRTWQDYAIEFGGFLLMIILGFVAVALGLCL